MLRKLPGSLSPSTRLLVLEDIDCCFASQTNGSSFNSLTERSQLSALKTCIDNILDSLPYCLIVATSSASASQAPIDLMQSYRLGTALALQPFSASERADFFQLLLRLHPLTIARRGLEANHGSIVIEEAVYHEICRGISVDNTKEIKECLISEIAAKSQVRTMCYPSLRDRMTSLLQSIGIFSR